MANKAVVILNFNGKKHLQNYLQNVKDNTSSQAKVIIIDNASTDDSLDYLKAQHPDISCIVLDTNYGFAEGYNLGLKQVAAEFLILLNSDVEVSPNWDLAIWEQLENPQIGAVQPKILDLKNKSKYEYAGACGGLVDALYLPFCRGRIFSELEDASSDYSASQELFWASGAAFGIRKSVFEKFGGFDADFFAHMEEIDLCFRMQNQGLSIACNPKSVVYHLGGGTLNMMSPFKTYLNYRNGLKLIFKNHYSSSVVLVLFKRMLLDGLSAANFLFRAMPSHSLAIFKGHIHFYRQLTITRKKRRHLKTLWTGKTPAGQYARSIVADYFIRGVKRFHQIDQDKISA